MKMTLYVLAAVAFASLLTLLADFFVEFLILRRGPGLIAVIAFAGVTFPLLTIIGLVLSDTIILTMRR